ncbi:MAG: hypothetical protein LH478_04785 [Chitinophagaceae bacterium]|nr:hypothetical protein [Chitinophagaceae bacterium]
MKIILVILIQSKEVDDLRSYLENRGKTYLFFIPERDGNLIGYHAYIDNYLRAKDMFKPEKELLFAATTLDFYANPSPYKNL